MGALQVNGRRIFFFGALGGLLFGYDTGVISGAILFITEDFGLSPFMQGAVVAALLLGAMVGAGFAGPMSDRLGRRRLIILAAVTFTVGALGAAAAPSAGALVAARFVIGLAVGSAALVVPLYLSEIAPTQIRGAISSLNQMMIVIGILAAFIVNAILASSGDWRLMLGLAAIPSLILLVGMFSMPETPRFLVKQGEHGEAREVLEEVTSDDGPRDETPERKIEEIREVEEEESVEGLRGLLQERWVRPALIVAIGLAVFQQFIGINTIIYYAPTTLTSVGFAPDSAIYLNLLIGTLNVLMTIVAIRIIDRVGRKPMLLFGLVGMVTSLTVLGLASELLAKPDSSTDPAAIITFICLAGFIVSFAATWGPVVWVMLPEVLPLSVRGTAMGVAVCLHWFANFLVSQSFPIMLDAWGSGPVFLGYAVIGVLAFLFVKAMVPETKGRSLEEIEAVLQRKTGAGEPEVAGAGGSGRFERGASTEERTPVRTRR
jgi:SP family sugar:H+ symporter-like MFS transporter